MPLTDARRATATRVIEALAGTGAALRADQLTAIEGLLEPGARVLVVQATGWGKSAVYWVATALRRAEGAGPTLVVSPLLSLMRDQVVAAGRAGLRAATLNSSNVGDWNAVESELLAGEIDVLLVSPERLANPRFGERVLNALTGHLGMLVIDEAHAVSDWGHDFRPDYRRVADAIRALNPDTPVLATTATANQRVTEDVAAQLSGSAPRSLRSSPLRSPPLAPLAGGTPTVTPGLRSSPNPDPSGRSQGPELPVAPRGTHTLVLRGPLARSSLQLAVIDDLTPLQRYAWVVENLPKLPGSGIVYTLTVADAQRLTDAIEEQHGSGLKVAAYTGQLAGDERERLEEALRRNELKALVATSALGMGYDKPDLGFCVHVGAPPSPVSYYQQVGRAGRGIDHAVVMLLTSTADAGVWDYFATASIPEPKAMRRLLDVTPDAGAEPASVPALEAESGLRRTKVELMLKQLAVDGVVDRTATGWLRTGKDWSYDAEHYDGVIAVRQREADIMRDYAAGKRCLMQLLQESLDDPTAAPCGRCSVCTGELPDELAAEPTIDVTRAVAGLLRTQAHLVEPRKMWPGGGFGGHRKASRIPAGEQAGVGRALIHADAPEWRDLIGTVFGGSSDAAPPDELSDAVVALLSGWRRDWPARPEVVIGLPAAGYPRLTTGLVSRIAEVGRLAVADLTVSDPVARDLSSPEEAAAWSRVIGVPDPAAVTGKVVLLVVDATGSLWPVTVAASMLRSNGSGPVLPLVVHRRV